MTSKGPIRAPAGFDAACENLAQLAFRTSGLFAPGLTDQDFLQEARIGVWEAIAHHDPDRGATFRSFALLCARRRMFDATTAALRVKHRAHNEASRLEAPAPDQGADYSTPALLADVVADRRQDPARTVMARETLAEVTAALIYLTPLERTAIQRFALNGEPYAEVGQVKQVDNALQRARRKLATSLPEAA